MLFPRLLFLVLLSIVGFAQTGGQANVWTPRGPEGGVVGRPVIDPQSPGTLYVNAGYGLLKTTDACWLSIRRIRIICLPGLPPACLRSPLRRGLSRGT